MNQEFVKALETEVRREDFDFRDLMNDFEFVKELNREIANRHDDVLRSLPTEEELNFLIQAYNDNDLMTDEKDKANRIYHLNRLKSAAIALAKNDPQVKPPRYEELDNNETAKE